MTFQPLLRACAFGWAACLAFTCGLSAAPADQSSADQAYAELGGIFPKTITDEYRNMPADKREEQFAAWSREYVAKGLAFVDAYPADPRRWDVILQLSSCVRGGPKGDETARNAARVDGLLASALTASDAPANVKAAAKRAEEAAETARANPGAEYPGAGPDIYDIKADGQQLITAAVAQARAEHKNVLVEFGGNWCIWCRRLHALMHSDPNLSGFLDQHFVEVMLDVSGKDANGRNVMRNVDVTAKYMAKGFGFPALAILTGKGKLLVTQSSATLEEGDHHNPAKVLAFLRQWQYDPNLPY
jgi:thiol-disulfide isomerase/thioredoxin